jgi:hypothetical protein
MRIGCHDVDRLRSGWLTVKSTSEHGYRIIAAYAHSSVAAFCT